MQPQLQLSLYYSKLDETSISPFQIHLIGTEPLVTRTFKSSSKTTMYELHNIIQVVIFWTYSHLYQSSMWGKR
jgi:hypothetical protein